mgnify:CR=1 FL=1|jgi:hypothetical protein
MFAKKVFFQRFTLNDVYIHQEFKVISYLKHFKIDKFGTQAL